MGMQSPLRSARIHAASLEKKSGANEPCSAASFGEAAVQTSPAKAQAARLDPGSTRRIVRSPAAGPLVCHRFQLERDTVSYAAAVRSSRTLAKVSLRRTGAGRLGDRKLLPVCDMPGCPRHVGDRRQIGLVVLTLSLAAFWTHLGLR